MSATFIRLTRTVGDPLYVSPSHIVCAIPQYESADKGGEFKHTVLLLASGDEFNVNETVEEIDARELGDYTPPPAPF